MCRVTITRTECRMLPVPPTSHIVRHDTHATKATRRMSHVLPHVTRATHVTRRTSHVCDMLHDTCHMHGTRIPPAREYVHVHARCLVPHATCHMPRSTCHMSHATCHMPATCHMSHAPNEYTLESADLGHRMNVFAVPWHLVNSPSRKMSIS